MDLKLRRVLASYLHPEPHTEQGRQADTSLIFYPSSAGWGGQGWKPECRIPEQRDRRGFRVPIHQLHPLLSNRSRPPPVWVTCTEILGLWLRKTLAYNKTIIDCKANGIDTFYMQDKAWRLQAMLARSTSGTPLSLTVVQMAWQPAHGSMQILGKRQCAYSYTAFASTSHAKYSCLCPSSTSLYSLPIRPKRC